MEVNLCIIALSSRENFTLYSGGQQGGGEGAGGKLIFSDEQLESAVRISNTSVSVVSQVPEAGVSPPGDQ